MCHVNSAAFFFLGSYVSRQQCRFFPSLSTWSPTCLHACVGVSVWVSVCGCVRERLRACVLRVHVCVRVRVCGRVCVCMVCMYACMYVCIKHEYIHIHVCIKHEYIHIHICIKHEYIHIHTHIHIHLYSWEHSRCLHAGTAATKWCPPRAARASFSPRISSAQSVVRHELKPTRTKT
jgi:hypothetical protein